jgi:hypothetical protein
MQYSRVGTGSAEMQKRTDDVKTSFYRSPCATSKFKLKFRFERSGGCYLYGERDGWVGGKRDCLLGWNPVVEFRL